MSDTAETSAETPTVKAPKAWNPGYTDPLDMPISLAAFLETLRSAASPDLIYGRMLMHKHKYTAASLKKWHERLDAAKSTPIPVTEVRHLSGPRRRR